ncbi:MAG: hypothetical protein O7J95_10225 [Planctomycetota bacterium]|nr:hypothetical protein [Planctomycetota bacterium]
MIERTERNASDPGFPRLRIVCCYKARQLSMRGPASVGYALFEFLGNRIVDIVVQEEGKEPQRLRHHVIQDRDRLWYFNPRPDLSPLLSMGLHDKPPSTEAFVRDSE